MSNTSIAGAGDLLVLQHADQSLLFGRSAPRDALIQPGRWASFSPSPPAPTRPRVRLLNTKWIVRMSARLEQLVLGNQNRAPAALAASWRHGSGSRQSDSFQKALPIRAPCDPNVSPSPRTPRSLFHGDRCPRFCCQPPDRTEFALRHDMSRRRPKIQRPGKFDRRVRPIPPA